MRSSDPVDGRESVSGPDRSASAVALLSAHGAERLAALFEDLANVAPGTLTGALVRGWGDGGASEAAKRIDALRGVYCRVAAHAPRTRSRSNPIEVRRTIDVLVQQKPGMPLAQAFRELAAMRHLEVETIRNAYYSSRNRDSMITDSRSDDLRHTARG